jgi:hypothetical protein
MTEWFDKTPGGVPTQEQGDGSVMALLGNDVPDWVRLPGALGGHRVRVLAASTGPCPTCDRAVRHLSLPDGLAVAECPDAGFLWYRHS